MLLFMSKQRSPRLSALKAIRKTLSCTVGTLSMMNPFKKRDTTVITRQDLLRKRSNSPSDSGALPARQSNSHVIGSRGAHRESHASCRTPAVKDTLLLTSLL